MLTRLATVQMADTTRPIMVPLHGFGVSSYVTIIKFFIQFTGVELFVQNLYFAHKAKTYTQLEIHHKKRVDETDVSFKFCVSGLLSGCKF